MKCGSLKRGMGGSELSTRGFISWFGLPQRRPYVHVVEALTKSIASGNQVSSVNTITATLILLSTKKLAHKGEEVSTSPIHGCRRRSTQSGGSMTSRRATKAPRRPAHRNTVLVHSRTSHKAQHLALTLSKELILALTLTKLVLSIRI